jgi:heavy metal sensor kinase
MSFEKPSRLRHSLSVRLTLWYAGIFVVCSFAAFFLFYVLIASVIRENTDQEILGQAAQLSAVLRERGVRALENHAWLEAQAAGERKIFIRLLYPTGEAFSSSNMAAWKDISVRRSAVDRLLSGADRVWETGVLSSRQEQVRILYTLIGPGVILQIGRSLENYARIIGAFQGIFLTTMAVLVGLAVGVGWFMARRAVSGIEAVTHTARMISAGALNKRVPVSGQGDEIDQLAGAFNRMLDRIEVLVTEIRQMADNIAHDLKSPLTRIRGNAEITLTTGENLTEYQAMAAGTIEECDRLLDVINTMLMISRTEAGVDIPAQVPLDLAEIVREACELFALAAEDKGLSLSSEAPESCRISGDLRGIQRMLANLIDNAVQYTDAGGTVRVSVADGHDNTVILKVEDTGIGMAEPDLSHIFDRFYRCDTSRSPSGTGLGLSLARAIARSHGGDITVQSRPGHGSVFSVLLPRS